MSWLAIFLGQIFYYFLTHLFLEMCVLGVMSLSGATSYDKFHISYQDQHLFWVLKTLYH